MKNLRKAQGRWLNTTASLLAALAIASLLIVIQGTNPLEAFSSLVVGAVGSASGIASSIRWSIPVIIASMASLVATKSGIINLGLEGQIYFAAFTAGVAGVFLPLPRHLLIPAVIILGGVVGLLYAIVPALLRVYLGVNEMISTLMLNYVAIYMTELITMRLMGLNADSNPELIATPEIPESAKLTQILPPYQASTGIFIALGIVALVFLFYRYTRAGYEWTQLGRNPRFARYGGVRERKNYIVVFLSSGFLAGVCGAVEILGAHYRFRNNFAQNLGWDGIMVALIAKDKPLVALVVGLLWGAIKAGSLAMERMTSVNRILVTLVQALFVLFITVDVRGIVEKLARKRKKRTKGGAA